MTAAPCAATKRGEPVLKADIVAYAAMALKP